MDQAGLMTDVVEPGEPNIELETNLPLRDLTMEQLKMYFERLGPYNEIDDNCKCLLTLILFHLPSSFTWFKDTLYSTSTSIIFLNIIRYFYRKLVLPILENPLNVESGELHIVLVGKGSFNNQFRPADWLIPGDSITDTILYSPWNCCIDAKVVYGIATGDLQLQHRHFWNNQAMEQQQPQVPDHWNSIRAQHQEFVPEIILGPINGAADWLTQITALADWTTLYNRNRFIIPYPPGGDLADSLPEIPLYKIIAAIEILLMLIPPHKATIHLAADLSGAAQPDVERLKEQYAFTPDGTVMTTKTECPALYSLFQTMFDPAPPQ